MTSKGLTLASGLIFSALFANGETVYITTAGANTSPFTDGSRITEAGINDAPILTLNGGPITWELYAITIQATAGTKQNGGGPMSTDITLVEDPEFGPNTLVTNPFVISQSFTESVSGSVATFAAVVGSTYIIPLTTGHFLFVTPLANANLGSNNVVDATFQLSSTAPEPSAMLLVGVALAALGSRFIPGTRLRNFYRR